MNYVKKARELRNAEDIHYNCAQAVLIPFVRDMNLSEEQARALGAHFGGGMRHGSTCGTITAALMVLGSLGYDEKTQSSSLTRNSRH